MPQASGKSRREFLGSLAVTIGSGSLLTGSVAAGPASSGPAGEAPAIEDVVKLIIGAIPGSPIKDTIDTFKAGDPSKRVTGIATTFLATLDVLRRAREIGANLVITHEPIYYNHLDSTEALTNDPVYQAKRRFLEESGIVIWRFHDYWHTHRPDGIIYGLVRRMGWEKGRVHPEDKRLYDISPVTFRELCRQCKERLGIGNLRVVGDAGMICRRVGLFAGWGGAMGPEQIELLSRQGADVVVCGETAEWTTCEYARDAVAAQLNKGLIVLGHANSEEPGMEDVVAWLRARLPGVSVTFVPAGDPFRFI